MDIIFNKFIPSSDLKKISMAEVKLYVPKDKYYLKNNLNKYNGKYYYVKDVTTFELLNELIGSYLAHKIDLDTVDYQIVKEDGKTFRLMSLCFYDLLYRYYHAFEIGPLTTNVINESLKGNAVPKKYEKIVSNLLKLIALDLKMGQADRNPKNVIIRESKINKNNINLSRAFDYGYSYTTRNDGNDMYYENPYIAVRKDADSISNFAYINPNIKEFIYILKSISIEDVLSEISSMYDILIPDDVKTYYKKKDAANNELFRKI
nr:hypothetical protein [Bacilli bacterium]